MQDHSADTRITAATRHGCRASAHTHHAGCGIDVMNEAGAIFSDYSEILTNPAI